MLFEILVLNFIDKNFNFEINYSIYSFFSLLIILFQNSDININLQVPMKKYFRMRNKNNSLF